MAADPPINVLVLWRTRRTALFQRLGVLSFNRETVDFYDRDESLLMSARGAELTATPLSKTQIVLGGPGDRRYLVVGAHTAIARQPRAKALIGRFQAHVVPPRYGPMSEEKWDRIWRPATNIYSSGIDNVTQHLVWRPVLLELLWNSGAAGRP